MITTQSAKLNDIGYKAFFTNAADDEFVVPMAWARNVNNRSNDISDKLAAKNIKDDFITGALHFGERVERDDSKVFFDVDLKSAYPTFLINYKRKKFNYKVGSNKRYFDSTAFFTKNVEGLRLYKFRFVAHMPNTYKSRLYRKWFLKTTKVKDLIITNQYISGVISIPDIENLVNRFLDDLQFYESEVVIDSMVVSTGDSNFYINEPNIVKAMRAKYDKNNPFQDDYKMMLNSSTGYIAIADKILYFTMVNQVKIELFKLWDQVDRWNRERPDRPIRIVAANTDGMTLYGDPNIVDTIQRIITYNLNEYSVFKFIIKHSYTWDEAHITKNDIRRRN